MPSEKEKKERQKCSNVYTFFTSALKEITALGCDFFSPNTNTQIHKRPFFISAKEKRFAEMKIRHLCICFVRKVISLDEFTDTHYKMTRSLFVYS